MSSTLPAMEVAIINPTGAKKMSTARNKKGQFKKGGRRRKARKKNPTVYARAAPRRRRRRRRRASTRGTTPARRRRRRPNPLGGGDKMPLKSQGMWPLKSGNLQLLLPMMGAKLAMAYAVRRWGNTGGLMGKGATSEFAGDSWTFRNYAIGFGTTYLGAKLIATRFGRKWGEAWWLAGMSDMITRLVWTEAISKWKWGREAFGQDSAAEQMAALRQMSGGMGYDPGQADALAGACMPGAVMDTPSGRFVLDNQKRWQPMQGGMGGFGDELVAARSGFDGFGDELVQARSDFDGMGHALPPGTDDHRARYTRSGAVDPYSNLFQQSV